MNATKAYESGFEDGQDRAMDAANEIDGEGHRLTDKELREEIESWFGDGQEEADAALLNALSGPDLAEALGVSEQAEEDRGPEFSEACREYNRGWRDGALAVLS